MESALINSSRGSESGKVITIDGLSTADKISVTTSRSNYQFSVSNPDERKGTLTGGLLGEQVLDAFFTGALSADGTEFSSSEVKPGSRAVFFVESQNTTRRLITSVITDIAINLASRVNR